MTAGAIPAPSEWTTLEIDTIRALVWVTRQYTQLGEETHERGPDPISLPVEYAAEALAAFGLIEHSPGSSKYGEWTGFGGDVLPDLEQIALYTRLERYFDDEPAIPFSKYKGDPTQCPPGFKMYIHKAPENTGIEDVPGSENWSAREKMLIVALVKMVDQCLTQVNFGFNGELDSWAMSAGEIALHFLEKLGLVELLPAGRFIGKWNENGLKLVMR